MRPACLGGAAIDAHGVTGNLPAASAPTGLFGNALGYKRRNAAAPDRLVVFGARREGEPSSAA